MGSRASTESSCLSCYICVCVCVCVRYPAVVVQQTSGDDGVEEKFVSGDDVVEVLSPLHVVPQLVPRALQNLHVRAHTEEIGDGDKW